MENISGNNNKKQELGIADIREHMETPEFRKIRDNIISEVIFPIHEIGIRLEEESGRKIMDNLTWRIKTPESIANKLEKKGKEISFDSAIANLRDIIGFRVVCPFQDDVYRMSEEIKKLPGIHILKEKNYIAHPKESGYRSIHLIAEVPREGRPNIFVEIQVRSVAMNYWAILEHQLLYKHEEKETAKLKKELKSYAIAIAKIDKKFLKLRKRIEKL